MARKLTTEEFIKRAKQVHGDTYDYSKAVYINSKTKVEIICRIHGSFFQAPNHHLRESGCMDCGGRKHLDNNSFIEKARKVHGDKYDYSLVKYKNNQTKVKIKCPHHGVFEIQPTNHLNPKEMRGCKKCSHEILSKERRKGVSQFIEEAKKKFGDKFDYSQVNYINQNTPVEIICSEHGAFWILPRGHLNKRGTLKAKGCPECSEKKKHTTKSFVSWAKKVHLNKYDYSKTFYKSMDDEVTITCPHHGEFTQSARRHVHRAQGCPTCGDELYLLGETVHDLASEDRYLEGQLYVINLFNDAENFYKIGITRNLKNRYIGITALPYEYEVLLEADIGLILAYQTEQKVLRDYSKFQYKPKIRFQGHTECLSVNPIDHDPYLAELFKDLD